MIITISGKSLPAVFLLKNRHLFMIVPTLKIFHSMLAYQRFVSFKTSLQLLCWSLECSILENMIVETGFIWSYQLLVYLKSWDLLWVNWLIDVLNSYLIYSVVAWSIFVSCLEAKASICSWNFAGRWCDCLSCGGAVIILDPWALILPCRLLFQ